jgi:hypothetical protein
MITITDAHVYRQLVHGATVAVVVPVGTVSVGEWRPVGEPWAVRNLGSLFAIEYLLTSESFFVTRDDLAPLVLPAETWHPAETLPAWGVRLWVEVQAGAGTTVTVQATKGARR